MRMVNYFSQFILNQSEITAPKKFFEERRSMDVVPGTLTVSTAFEGHPIKQACFKVL